MQRADVKRSPRSYDASGRRHRADERRARVVEVARTRFLRDGYAVTTVADVAADAGVSVETIYKAFGGKAGLARALWDAGLAGAGPEHAEQRSDEVAGTTTDAGVMVRQWTTIGTEVVERVGPLLLMLRDAAATDAEVADLLDRIVEERLARMAHNASALAAHLRPGVSVADARDVLVAYTTPELYDLLVRRQGWSLSDFADFQRRGIIAQLL